MIQSLQSVSSSVRNLIPKTQSNGEDPSDSNDNPEKNSTLDQRLGNLSQQGKRFPGLSRSINPKTVNMALESNARSALADEFSGSEPSARTVGGTKPDDPNHFTPEKTAERLQEFTENLLSENPQEIPEDSEKLREKVQSALNDGFQQAESELGDNLGEPAQNLVNDIKNSVKQSLSSFLGNISSSNLQGVRVSLMRGQQELNQALTRLMAQQNQQASENSRIPTELI